MDMKRLVMIALVATFSLLGYAQKVKPVEYGGSITLKETVDKRSDVYKVRVIGYGKKDAQAQEDAEVRVIRMALYTGIDGVCRPVLREETDKLDDFFERKQYKDFISDVTPAGGLVKQKGLKVKKMPFDITVRIGAMEQYMRRNGYKKQLGF